MSETFELCCWCPVLLCLCDFPAIKVLLSLWKPLQSVCEQRQAEPERPLCPPRGRSHRLFTASLHVRTVYEPRGRPCQLATTSQPTQNLSQSSPASRGADKEPANLTTAATTHLETLMIKLDCLKPLSQSKQTTVLVFCLASHLHFQFQALTLVLSFVLFPLLNRLSGSVFLSASRCLTSPSPNPTNHINLTSGVLTAQRRWKISHPGIDSEAT